MPISKDELKLALLREHIKTGADPVERGDFVEVADHDLEEISKNMSPSSLRQQRGDACNYTSCKPR